MKKEKTPELDFGHLNKTEQITRKVAIAVAFLSVFYFFIKLLFL